MGAGQELGAVNFLLLHALQPTIRDRLDRLAPVRDGFRLQRRDRITALRHHVGSRRSLQIPHRSRHARGRQPRIGIDDGFEVLR